MLLTRREAVGAGLAFLPAAALAQGAAPLGFNVEVPLDHDRPELGAFPLQCEWGAAPVAGRMSVLAVADGQQFFVRPGGAARLQKDLFGSSLNLLTIVGRSRSDSLARLVMKDGATDWRAAYRLLNWTQWARDLALVVRRLGLERNGLGLYGRSGGAHLIHQYLTLYPQTQARIYLQAAVNHDLDVFWAVGGDRFWSEFSQSDAALARQLAAWVERHPDQRKSLMLVLQRQHFFEPLEGLAAARAEAARAFIRGDSRTVADLRKQYQIDALEQMDSTLEGVGSAVRVYEFSAPHRDPRSRPGPLAPSREALFYYGQPLSDAPYRPAVAKADWSKLRTQSSEVLQIAGRHDHTCDYRTQIGLNGMTRGSTLIILDDNHVFSRWTATGGQARFVQAYFSSGAAGPEFQREIERLGGLRWSEHST